MARTSGEVTRPSRGDSPAYVARRAWITEYFDRTAARTWAQLTSDAPLGRVRASVREGRTRMRELLLSWLPERLDGRRVLDAGCGTGAMAVELALRGASVVAVDVASSLVDVARERAPRELAPRLDFVAGDMLDTALGDFDHVVAMDSLIHYEGDDALAALAALAARTRRSMLFTFAPKTPLLTAMHGVGRLFPRGARAPAIEPASEERLRRSITGSASFEGWRPARSERVRRGFYTSQAVELRLTNAAAPRGAHA